VADRSAGVVDGEGIRGQRLHLIIDDAREIERVGKNMFDRPLRPSGILMDYMAHGRRLCVNPQVYPSTLCTRRKLGAITLSLATASM
jgi:hypothetical protein